mgnify:CR=1 FL=1
MASENTIKAFPLVYGTAGTRSTITGASTDTSNPYPMPRQDFTLELTAATTGTSGYLASVVLQASNDALAWFVISSATASATSAAATAAVTRTGAGVTVTNTRYAYTRTVGTYSGTGSAVATMAF